MPRFQSWLSASTRQVVALVGVVVAATLLAGWTAAHAASPAPIPNRQSLGELPIGMMVHPPSLDYFNAIARPDDIGAVLIVNTQLLPRITSGKRLVMSPSVEMAEEQAEEFVRNAEYFGYNIEHWPDTPAAEQQDPASAGHAAAEFARTHELGYVIGPDLQFTEEAGADLAREAEIYVIQGQRLQEDVPRFQATVTAFAQAVRSGNPAVKVWVQVSASFGTPQETMVALEGIRDQIDGIWIHYNQSAQSFASLQELVELLRPVGPPPRPTPTDRARAPATPRVPATEVAAPTATPQADAPAATGPPAVATPIAPPPPATPTPAPAGDPLIVRWLPLIGAAMIAVAGGLVALGFALGYLWHAFRSRAS